MRVFTLAVLVVGSGLDLNVNQQLLEIADRRQLPGFAVAGVNQEDVLFQNGYGWADIERKIPYQPYSVQNIGSLSKTFIGVSLMRLVEQERIRLDDDITGICLSESRIHTSRTM